MAACNTMLAALHYGRLGLSVLPVWHPSGNACACPQGKDCHSPAKHPLLAEWQKKASSDTDVILEWWKRWPSANVGVVLGPHRLLVDADKDKGGLSTLAELERAHGPLSEEWSAVSGGGGRHHVLALPAGKNVKSRAERLGAGLDIRSGDAYFLVAPSQHVSGGRYNWLHRPMQGEPPPAPGWLLELLADKKPTAPGREHEQPAKPGGLIGVGKRHEALIGFARRIRPACKSYSEFEAALKGWGADRCQPSMEPDECIRQAKDLYPRLATVTGAIMVRRADDIEPKPIEWLWPGRIARGKLSLLAGHPGVGKSQLALAMAATVSRGFDWPDGSACAPGSALILSAEDGAGDTIVPRLMANGAELSRVHVIDGVREGVTGAGREVRRELCLPDDIDRLGAALKGIPEAALVIVDPISAYLGSLDSHRNSEVRGLLSLLSTLAAEHNLAVVAISHLNKNTAGDALSRVTGSLAFVAAALSAWLVGKDSHGGARRLFVPLKNNLSRDQAGLAFEFSPTTIGTKSGARLPTTALLWLEGEVTTTADEILAGSGAGRESGNLAEAEEFLSDVLAEGRLPSSEVRREAAETRISWRTLTRAKDNLGVTASRDKFGSGGRWFWTLPKDANSPKEANNENLASLAKNGPFPLKNAKDAKTTEWASLGDPTGPESDQGRPESGGWDDLEI